MRMRPYMSNICMAANSDSMKRIQGTIYVECDLCWKKVDWTKTCVCCGHTVCIKCYMAERHMYPVCGGEFYEPFPQM